MKSKCHSIFELLLTPFALKMSVLLLVIFKFHFITKLFGARLNVTLKLCARPLVFVWLNFHNHGSVEVGVF